TLDDTDLDATIRAAGFSSLEGLLQSTEHEIHDTSLRFTAPNFQEPFIESFWDADPIFSTSHLAYHPQRVFSMTKEGTIVEILNAHEYVPRGPSVTFSKQTWWDALLPLYSQDPHQASQKIFQDLNFLLNLYEPARRALIQPSVVLSALAMATLMRSSETGLGREGRKFALWLRDAAQASLDASINASWIDPSLAQAAFSSTHPLHSSARASSAVYLLDSIIQALGLSAIDAHDPTVSMFPADEIPITSTASMTSLFGEDIPPMNRMAACPWHGTDPCPPSCSHSPLDSDYSPQSTNSQKESLGNIGITKEVESASHKMTNLQENAFGKIEWP
ncbi:12475_t:CDS:2, partial [Acaulospora colombiana]